MAALPAFRASDPLILSGLGLLAIAAWITPARHWNRLARVMAAVSGRTRGDPAARRIRNIRRVTAGYDLPMTPEEIARGVVANHMFRNLHIMRSHMPGGWHPEVTVEGAENLDLAVARSNGAVIGTSFFCWVDEIGAIGAYLIGHPVSVLTQITHGYSPTRFGVRFINPIRCKLDERYARERIPLRLDQPVAALRTMMSLLRQKRVLALGFREKAADPVRVPFLGGTLALGSGPVDIAYKSGAPLITAHTIRTAVNRYRVICDPELEIRRDLPRREAAALALAEYAKRLEPLVLAHPEQWSGWRFLPDD